MNEWINEWMNEWINEWMNEMKWNNEIMKWMNEWMKWIEMKCNEMNEWMKWMKWMILEISRLVNNNYIYIYTYRWNVVAKTLILRDPEDGRAYTFEEMQRFYKGHGKFTWARVLDV